MNAISYLFQMRLPDYSVKMIRRGVYYSILVTVLFTENHALAGILTWLVDIDGPVSGAPSLPKQVNILSSFDSNNDDSTFSNLYFPFFPLGVTSNTAPVDFLFEVDDSSGTTEYNFTFNLENDTGTLWQDIRYQLGFINDSGEFESSQGTGLDFDWPHKNYIGFGSSFSFDQVDHSESELHWSNGNGIGVGFAPSIRFAIDIPDHTAIPSYAHTTSGYQFVLQFQAISTPEPSTLLGLGLLSLLLMPRRSGKT